MHNGFIHLLYRSYLIISSQVVNNCSIFSYLNMHNKKYIFSLLLIIFLSNLQFAQIRISGQINNEKNIPIEYVEITLENKDGVIIKSELTDSKGKFYFQVNQNYLLLVVRKEGAQLYSQQLDLQNDINLGIIKIIEKQQTIQEVKINGKRKLIERKIDRLVYNVENSIAATGGDALDAIRNTPSVRVQNDQISIIGKNGIAVMVNDKIIQLSGEDLISYLKTIPSDNIKSIEVVTTPPAKYDAEGNSGIININLKKAKKNAVSGNVRGSYTQAKYALGTLGAGLDYQKNDLTIVSNVNYTNGSIAPYQEYTLTYPNYNWLEKNEKKILLDNLSSRIAVDYNINSKTIIGLQYTGSNNNTLNKGINRSFITNKLTLDSLIITPSRINSYKKSNSLNFHSITKLDTIGANFGHIDHPISI